MQNNEWLTVKEALKLLQITSRTTLSKYLLRYNVRLSKPMGRVYISQQDIMATIERKSVRMGV